MHREIVSRAKRTKIQRKIYLLVLYVKFLNTKYLILDESKQKPTVKDQLDTTFLQIKVLRIFIYVGYLLKYATEERGFLT